MYRLASTAVYSESYRSLDEVLRTVEALTADEVSALAAEFFAPERQTVVSLGPMWGEPNRDRRRPKEIKTADTGGARAGGAESL